MALNFPDPSQSPYFNPESGLKYIYNTSIGAWETAVQPPAVCLDTPPAIDIEGFLWWDSDDSDLGGRLKILYNDIWVDATPIPPFPPICNIGPAAPTDPRLGDLWYDNTIGRLYIWYEDPGNVNGNPPTTPSSQWVDAAPDVGGQDPRQSDIVITQSATPPSNPKINDLWFDNQTGNMYIYYVDPDSSQWVVVLGAQGLQSGTSTNLTTLLGQGAIQVTGTINDPIIGIRTATATDTGAVKLADSTEATAATSLTTALTPGVLKANIDSYVTPATLSAGGTVELASSVEIVAGTDTLKAITPKALKDSLPSLGGMSNPIGTVIEFASITAPTGYLLCNGALVSRTTYAALFAAIGTSFGIGDGATTFKLPTLTHASNTLLSYCIKF